MVGIPRFMGFGVQATLDSGVSLHSGKRLKLFAARGGIMGFDR